MLLVTAKSCPFLISTGTISLQLVYRDFVVTVNDYILICINGLPKSIRPNVCPNCGGSKIHRHGKFTDAYFNIGSEWPENVPFTLFRFLCYSHCNGGKDFTFTFFPCFKEPYQSIGIPLQEKFIHCIEAGMNLNQAVLQIFPKKGLQSQNFSKDQKENSIESDIITSQAFI